MLLPRGRAIVTRRGDLITERRRLTSPDIHTEITVADIAANNLSTYPRNKYDA
jgi:hypothetical protein